MTEKEWPTRLCTCGESFIMADTDKGGRIPVNPKPEPGGNIVLRDYGKDAPTASVLTVRQQFGRTNLYKTHFATCAHAKRHRTGDRRLGS